MCWCQTVRPNYGFGLPYWLCDKLADAHRLKRRVPLFGFNILFVQMFACVLTFIIFPIDTATTGRITWRCLRWWRRSWTTLDSGLAAWMETRYRKCWCKQETKTHAKCFLFKLSSSVCLWVVGTQLCTSVVHLYANMESQESEHESVPAAETGQAIKKRTNPEWFWKPKTNVINK